YHRKKDLERWKNYAIPILIIVYSPKRKKAYWRYFPPQFEEESLSFSWEDKFTRETKELLTRIYKETPAWFRYQKEKARASDVELLVLNERFQNVDILSRIIEDEYRKYRKCNELAAIGIMHYIWRTFNFKEITLNFFRSGYLKYKRRATYPNGEGKGTVNIYDFIFHLYKGKLYVIRQNQSWYEVLLVLLGIQTEVEFEYYPGIMDPTEINIVSGYPVYKVELIKSGIRKRGKLKISLVTSSI
ncbi:MAG: hypothetical protein ACFFC7_29380, partial [Candidatus Hermodarchaeota archaeon]